MLKLLAQLENIDGDKKDKDVKQFTDTISGIRKFGKQADKTLDMMIKADESWFFSGLLKLLK